jgi:DNA-binding MarR family transcriptional regulator
MKPGPLSLTTEERILLYLSDFRNMEERFELPLALTQKAIAFAAGIQRKHVSRYLDELVKDGLVAERKAHVEGQKQRMLAYYLAASGWRRALEIKDHLGTLRVPVRIGGEIAQMSLQEIDKATSVRLTFADIVREAMDVEVLDMAVLEKIDERRRRDMDARLAKIEAYTKAMLTAWQDGKVTATEQLLLQQLREHLAVSEAEHRRIEGDIMRKVLEEEEAEAKTYRDILRHARDHGIDPKVKRLLVELREVLDLDPEEAREIEEDVGLKL